MATIRRRGRWTYVSDPINGPRWRLDGTTLDLEYDDLHSGCSLRGAWVLWLGERCTFEPIDHFLDGSMEWVERSVDRPDSFGGGEEWAVSARAQLMAPKSGGDAALTSNRALAARETIQLGHATP